MTALLHNWFSWNLDPTSHWVILIVVLILLGIQTLVNIYGARVMGGWRGWASTSRSSAPWGVALILAIKGFHHGLGFLFSTQNVQHLSSNPLGLNFHGSWFPGAALIAVLAPVYIFYGFEAAGDISEETKDAGRQVPRAMRWALIFGGIASFILIAALLLAMPAHNAVGATVKGGGVPFILAELPSGVQDFLLLLIIFAFFSCGSSVQGAGTRLAFSYARDGALPASSWVARVSPRHKMPVNALLVGTVVTVLFVLLTFISPNHNVHFGFITYPANTNVLVSLVSFGVSGIYLSFLMTVIAATIARARGGSPRGLSPGTLGVAGQHRGLAYLGLMFVNIVLPTGLTSPRGYFNLDWITLTVMVIIAIVGAVYFLIARPDSRGVSKHLHDDLEPSGAEIEQRRGRHDCSTAHREGELSAGGRRPKAVAPPHVSPWPCRRGARPRDGHADPQLGSVTLHAGRQTGGYVVFDVPRGMFAAWRASEPRGPFGARRRRPVVAVWQRGGLAALASQIGEGQVLQAQRGESGGACDQHLAHSRQRERRDEQQRQGDKRQQWQTAVRSGPCPASSQRVWWPLDRRSSTYSVYGASTVTDANRDDGVGQQADAGRGEGLAQTGAHATQSVDDHLQSHAPE